MIIFKLKPPIKGYVRIGNVSHSSGSDVCLLHNVSKLSVMGGMQHQRNKSIFQY